MAKLLKLRRGTTSQHSSFTGAEGEVTVDTDKDVLVVNDGSTAGGHPLAAEDMSNVSSASIAGRLGTDSIATTKIAAGALPTDVTVASANLVDGTIVNADVNASAAIAGTKVSPDFGSQTIATTGKLDIGGSSGAAIEVPNNRRITLGNSGEFFLVHAANYSQIKETGSDNLYIDASHIHMRDENAQNKLQTGSSGITVSGNIAVTGTVDGIDIATDVAANTAKVTNATHTGDVTGATSLTIANDAVTFAKMQNIGTPSFLGRNSSGTGNVENLSVSDVRTMLNVEDGATADQTSTEIKTLLASDNLTNAHIANGSIGDAKLANNAVITARINNDAVTADKLFNVPQNHILGRIAAGTANVETLTGAQIRTIINVEDGATADQTGAEIANALNGENIYTTGRIGYDSNDYMQFTQNNRLDLYVNGNNEFRFESDGDFHADGDVIAYSTTTASDENLKKDITIIPDSLEKVEAIKGVTFKWNKNDQASAGVIAQDVQKVLPEVVREVNDFDGSKHLAVNYSGLTSILIEAIKELSEKVKVLEAK